VIARNGVDVIRPEPGILASDACELAGITYRQLDYWARQAWIRPTVDAGEGRAGRRRYAVDDVVRLALLRHLAMSGINPANVAEQVSALVLPSREARIVWGPVGSRQQDEPTLVALDASSVLGVLEGGGAYVVFDPSPVRARAERVIADGDAAVSPESEVRTA
jgi:DNA-binding transcriptional MerR regulator